MSNTDTASVMKVQAVLSEIYQAMKELVETDQTYTIYIGNTGLTEEEQVMVLETLGRGKVTISFTETDQPVDWYESAFAGVWIGTYRNAREDAIVYTVEVSRYPQVAGAFNEDIVTGAEELRLWAETMDVQ